MRPPPLVPLVVIAGAVAMALAGARSTAGSWNDGSRLAAAEALVDHGGWTIDPSIFVDPRLIPPGAPPPYPPTDRLLNQRGTLDRLYIDGRFVSDKTPLSNALLAGQYWVLQRATGLVMRTDADRVIYWLTVVSAGAAFVATIWIMFGLAVRVTASSSLAVAVTASLGVATCAAAYSTQINAHGIALAGTALATAMADAASRRGPSRARLLGLGSGLGLVYGFDVGLGVPLVAAGAWFAWSVSHRGAWWYLLAALPWIVAQHTLYWQIGHTLAPLNTIPAYLTWPGSPFAVTSATGRYAHDSMGHLMLYSVDLLVGRRGFLLHNLPLLLLPIAVWQIVLNRRAIAEWPAVRFALLVGVSGWLTYAAGSTNRSGVALSIRWFVPLLAPLFYVLLVSLRTEPGIRPVFFALSAIGGGMGLSAWVAGPWQPRVPLFWWWVGAALLVLAVGWARRRTVGPNDARQN